MVYALPLYGPGVFAMTSRTTTCCKNAQGGMVNPPSLLRATFRYIGRAAGAAAADTRVGVRPPAAVGRGGAARVSFFKT